MRALLKDLRLSLRQLRRQPSFAAAVVLTLALGIGATTSIVSIVDAVILKPLPFHEPQRLVHIWEGGRGDRYVPGEEAEFIYARPGTFYDWRGQTESFESMAAYWWRKKAFTAADRVETLWAQDVTEGFFETLGASALLGRTFGPTDYRPSSARLVILSFRVWSDRFGKDPNIIGQSISLDREPYEVVGIMPVGFYPTREDPPDLWTPHWSDEKQKSDRISWGLTVFARLKQGITLQQAQADLDVVANRMATDYPKSYENMGAVIVPVDAQLIGGNWKLFLLLSGAVALLLLIACVNAANLLMARVVDRDKEFAIRIALGASRLRLLGQLFVENSVVALAAGALGVVIAASGTPALLRLLPTAARLPRVDSVRIDFPVLIVISLIVLAAILFFSLTPLVRLSQTRPYETLKSEGRGASLGQRKRRLGQAFVVSEFALSLVLLVVGALLVQSFRRLSRVDPGFAPSNLLAMEIQVPQFRYGPYQFEAKNTSRKQLYERLEQRLSGLPDVEAIGLTAKLPLRQAFDPWAVSVVGRPPEPVIPKQGEVYAPPTSGFIKHGDTSIQRVNPAFFRTLGLRLIRGRFLEETDTAEIPLVTVVNETFARHFFPNGDPVGEQVVIDHTSWFPKLTIVGVVSDAKLNGLDRKPLGEMFWSIRQVPPDSIWVIARTRTNSPEATLTLQKEIREVDRDLAIASVESMRTVIEESVWRTRVAALLLGLLAGLSLTLAVTGIYSVMSYSVSQRTKELGIRIAFGAGRSNITSLVLGETLRLAGIGILFGCAGSLAAGRLVAEQLYGVTGSDPTTYLLTSSLLIVVALAASYVPARRALRVDPMVALQ
jgi:predicted permease